ncbi:MAG: DUF1499 domain-containing protein [Pseudomonadota bacterium]
MKIIMYMLVLIVLSVAAFAVYVRLAPSDVSRWHQPVAATENADLAGGAIRVMEADRAAFEKVDAAMQSLPRTQVLAGSVQDGRITYVTRTQLWGFPDYTTVQFEYGTLKLFARLRFGGSDLGVNAARIAQVLAAVEG